MKIEFGRVFCLVSLFLVLLSACSEQASFDSEEYLRRAQRALSENKPLVANIEAKNALLKDKENLQARWVLAQVYLKIREGLAAETEINKLLAVDFEAQGIGIAKLQALMLQGRYDEVVTSATKLNPSSGELAVRAAAYISMGDIQRGGNAEQNRRGYAALAKSDLAKAISQDSSNQLAHIGLAKLALRELDFAAASRYLQIAEQIDALNPDVWNQRGIVAQMQGNFTASEEAFRHAAEVAPYNLLVNLNFARILIAQNKGGEALAVLDEQVRFHTKMPVLHYLRSLAFIQGGNLEHAADVLNGVVKDFPHYAEAQLLLGRVLTDLGQFGQAEVALGTVLELYPDQEQASQLLVTVREAAKRDPETVLREAALSKDSIKQALLGRDQEHASDAKLVVQQQYAAERLMIERSVFLEAPAESQKQIVYQLSQRGDYQKIIDLALARAQENKNDAQAADWAGLANMLRGDFQAARQFLDIALGRDPNLTSALNNLADLELRTRNLAAAEDLFTRSLTLAPDNPIALLGKARLRILNGDLEGAEEFVEKAGLVDGYKTMARYVQAEIHAADGDTDGWRGAIEQLKNEDELAIEPHLLLAKYHARQQTAQKALDELAAAAAKAPNSPDLRRAEIYVYTNIGRHALNSGANNEARDAFEKVLQIEPNNVLALNNLAWMYHLQGRLKALELAEKAHSLNPESVSVLDTLGWILLGHGENERAVQLLARAAETQAGEGDIKYHYAVALQRIGRHEEALAELQAALASDNLSMREEALALREAL